MPYIGAGTQRFNTADGLTVSGNTEIDGGTIKLDGNFPTGTNNVALGDTALDNGSLSGASNTAIGFATLTENTSGNNNTAVGSGVMAANTTGANNTSVGLNSLAANTTGSENDAFGSEALDANTTGAGNVAIGRTSFTSVTTGNNNAGLGYQTGYYQTGSQNTFVGSKAGIGADGSSTADNNTGVGYLALTANTTGYSNTAVGTSSLAATTTGRDNTAIGHGALDANTTANNNVAVGKNALGVNTTGASNTAVGTASLDANTTGSNNTAVGTAALGANTTASSNTAVGHNCLAANTTGTNNACFGRDAGERVTTGSQNTLIGDNAGENITTADDNTFIGRSAGSLMTSGADNTIIGRFNGNQDGVDMRTANNHIAISDGAGNCRILVNSDGDVRIKGSNSNAILTNAHSGAASATNRRGMVMSGEQLVMHTGSGTANNDALKLYTGFSGQAGSTFAALQFLVQSDGDVQNRNNSYGSTSDLKLKQDITAASSQWNDIKALQVKNYRFKDQVANLGDDNAPTMLGVVAQDLESAGMNGLVIDKPDIVDGVDLGTVTKSVKYSVLYMKAVKALQEAMARIETLETEMTALKARVTALEDA